MEHNSKYNANKTEGQDICGLYTVCMCVSQCENTLMWWQVADIGKESRKKERKR